MPDTRRSYGEGCIGAHALDLIGDRWALLIVRELMLGPLRFAQMRQNMPGIASNMLARRLEELEAAGVLRRQTLTAPAGAPGYALTPAGHDLLPILDALCRWGAAMPGHDPMLPISPSALMLSMRAMLNPSLALAEDRSAGFVLGNEAFSVAIRGGRHEAARTDRPQGELVFSGHPNSVAHAVYGPWSLSQSVREGRVEVTGNPDRAQAFIDMFSLPYMPKEIRR